MRDILSKRDLLIGLSLALFLALAISPFASPLPDGLEKVAEDLGFLGKAAESTLIYSPLPDYAWPNVENEMVRTSFAGLLGTLLLFAAGYAIAAALKRR